MMKGTGNFFNTVIYYLQNSLGRTKTIKYRKYGTVFLLGGAAVAGANSSDKISILSQIESANRFLRSVRIGFLISSDYFLSSLGLNEKLPNYDIQVSRIHQRAAERLLQGCLENGGLYIKLGQGLVALNHILPGEYLNTLEVLHDKCLTRQGDEVTQIFLEDFGQKPTEIFEEFNMEPIAAASLAQVYKAKTKNGEEVAVKVQYIDLQERFYSDIATIKFLLRIIEFMHPNFGFSWVLDDLADALKQELDFVNEGKNGEKCAKDLQHLKFTYVPKVYWNFTTKRILTTEFIHGIKVDDMKTLKKEKFSLFEIDYKLFHTFGYQIFITGFVHADPHPGNVMIRRDENKNTQIVLLDHGLYENVKTEDRIALANFWKSIVLGDMTGVKRYSKQLGVDDFYTFAEILTQRPLTLDFITRPQLTKEDLKYMTDMAKARFDKIMKCLRSMPRTILLVIRNLNTVRSIAMSHGSPINRFKEFARISCHCDWIMEWRKRMYFEFRLWYLNMKVKMFKLALFVLYLLGFSSQTAEHLQ